MSSIWSIAGGFGKGISTMQKLVLLSIGFIVWIYFLTVFKRKKLDFFFFLTGSVGMFFLSFFTLQPVITPYLARFVCYLTGVVGNLTGFFEAYTSYGVLFIDNVNGPVSLYVDFECAGLIEILVFISLIVFFDAYNVRQKILVSLEGVVWILMSNILRLFIISFASFTFSEMKVIISHIRW